MEQFEFDKLNDDDRLEMLKYLPIRERVRFERINTEFARLLDRLWLGQKQLQFGRVRDWPGFECHPIELIDQYEEYNDDILAEIVFKVLVRCKNLKALKVNSHFSEDLNNVTRLANILNDICKELEHLDIWQINLEFFELFTPSDKFTCLLPLRDDSVSDNLKRLYQKQNPAVPMKLKIINHGGWTFGASTLDMIDMSTVEYLFAHAWNERFNELVNLKRMSVNGVKPDQIGPFVHLEYIRFDHPTNAGLHRIFADSLKLVSLHLRNATVNLVATLAEVGSNLKTMHFDFEEVTVISDNQLWQKLAKLTKLRELSLFRYKHPHGNVVVVAKLDANGLAVMLKTCTKLKYFNLRCINAQLVIAEEQKEQIRKVVADKLVRRPFEVIFHSHSIASHSISIKPAQ